MVFFPGTQRASAPALLTISLHRGTSASTKDCNAASDRPMGQLPIFAIEAFTSLASVALAISLARRATMASGVPRGTNTPDQPSSAAPGYPASPTVGTS